MKKRSLTIIMLIGLLLLPISASAQERLPDLIKGVKFDLTFKKPPKGTLGGFADGALFTKEGKIAVDFVCGYFGVSCGDAYGKMKFVYEVLGKIDSAEKGKGRILAPKGYEVCRAYLRDWNIRPFNKNSFTGQLHNFRGNIGVALTYEAHVHERNQGNSVVSGFVHLSYVRKGKRDQYNCRNVHATELHTDLWLCRHGKCKCGGEFLLSSRKVRGQRLCP